MALKVNVFQFNGFQENTYLVSNDSGEALIFDPGCYSREEELVLTNFIEENKLTICAALYTHAHIDHILGAEFVREKYKCSSYLHPLDHSTWTSVANYAHVYGFEGYKSSALPENYLEDGQVLHIDKFKIQVRHTPGHAPGHVVFYFEQDNFIINGDVLFRESFGRVDLPGGDLETLKKSIFDILFQYPDETIVYCGHGPNTTIGHEKQYNYINQY
jgi:hydroxyacylglutathione hydrolase